ncbi:MAG TPA: metalloregulator ArsR/SmtB family transcription factor [Thermoanaerobaculia bacterium]|nr:metalloregulator ArsR/SmtB family transcription factor [Thermoanaerobaculia bacterium]
MTGGKGMMRHAEMSPEALKLVAARFRVLAEPVRLGILQALESAGECSIGELAESLNLSQPNVSKHVKILLEAGLVARRQEGNTVYCSIGDDSVFELCDVVCSSIRDRLTAQSAVLERTRTRR